MRVIVQEKSGPKFSFKFCKARILSEAKTLDFSVIPGKGSGGASEQELAALQAQVDALYPTKSVGPAAVVAVDDALAGNAQGLTVAIEPVQDGSGDPSPDNVRPIIGWTGANVYRGGADQSDPVTIPVSFAAAGTVYGGTLDVVNGTLTVDRAMVDLPSTLPWSTWGVDYLTSGITGFYIYRNSLPSTMDFSNIGIAVLTNLLLIRGSVWGGYAVGYLTNASGDRTSYWYEIVSISNETAGILSTDTNAEAVEKFKAFLASTPLNVVYELASPTTYQLTPQQIALLRGDNTLWADTGDVALTYKQDVALLLEKLQS